MHDAVSSRSDLNNEVNEPPMYHSHYFATHLADSAVTELFGDRSMFRAWLRVEVALAAAQARVGIVPEEAAAEIAAVAKLSNLDLTAMQEEYKSVGFPILPLVHQLAKACDTEAGRWVHFGATTQDIIDTGLVLQVREALRLVEHDLDRILSALCRLTETHRDTVMVGRTFQQHAAPITFGLKSAIWLDELLRHKSRLSHIRPTVLRTSLGGAVGTLATLQDKGAAVSIELAKELELDCPPISWHTSRDGWAELLFWAAAVGATLAKIATEVATLMRTEVDELHEPYAPGKGASSTMPQKRNPTAAPPMIAIGTRLRDLVGSQLAAMIQEHERAVGAMPIEWMVIPESLILLSGSVARGAETLEGLTVNADRMHENLISRGDFFMSESVMMALASTIGKGAAHELVTDAASRAREEGTSLREQLLADRTILERISKDAIEEALIPSNYLGATGAMISAVLDRAMSMGVTR